MSSEEIPDPIAALEQALAGMKEIVKIVRTYYTQAIAQGFDERQALQLTIAYQAVIIRGTLAGEA